MFENELDANLEEIFQSNNFGVILAIGQTCKKLGAKQSHFLVALMKALKCFEENHQNKFLLNLSKMTPSNTGDYFEEWNEITPQTHIRKFEKLMA